MSAPSTTTVSNAAAVAITELSRRERRSLEKQHPELSSWKSGLLLMAEDEETLKLIRRLIEAFVVRDWQMRRIIEAMLPALEVPSEASILQARRNAAEQEALLQDPGAFSAAQVADLAGSKAKNRAALASRWQQEGRILGVRHRGQLLYPAFQFDADGRPLPVISRVLKTFGEGSGSWETALWFTAANGWLGGVRPVDLLAKEPDKVVDAARREVSELVF